MTKILGNKMPGRIAPGHRAPLGSGCDPDSAKYSPPPNLSPGRVLADLDLANQVQGRSQSLLAFFPLGWAHFAWVSSGVLGSFQLAQGFRYITGDFVGVDFNGLDHAFRVDQEGAAQGQAFFCDMHTESVGQGVGRIPHQRELSLAYGRRGFVPDFVGEMGIGGDDVNFGAGIAERSVVVGSVFDFSRAVEGEGSRHEDQYRPLAFQRLLGHFDELTVVERIGLERLNLGVDKGHRGFLVRVEKATGRILATWAQKAY